MEADWEMELGQRAPVIDASWAGLVDLRTAPERVEEIAETQLLPGLAAALVCLNGPHSAVWTAKCDVWRVEDEVDLFELDAEPGQDIAMACYIDLLPRANQGWITPQKVADACKALVEKLRGMPLRACRVDLVVRAARIANDAQELGISAYLIGAGADEPAARSHLGQAVAAFADTASSERSAAHRDSPVQ